MAGFDGRPWNEWIARYARSHEHPVNRLCHAIVVSVPLSFIGLAVPALFRPALALFLLGWGFQFLGHAIEGTPPEFLRDWRFLFVGLRWWIAKVRGRA